jgi:hypothetical protein
MPSAAFRVPPSKHRVHPTPDVWPAEALEWFAAQPEGKAANALYEAGKAKFERQVAEEGLEVVGAITRCLKALNAGNATHPLVLNRTASSNANDGDAVAQAALAITHQTQTQQRQQQQQQQQRLVSKNRTTYTLLNGTTTFKYKEHRPDKGRGVRKHELGAKSKERPHVSKSRRKDKRAPIIEPGLGQESLGQTKKGPRRTKGAAKAATG